MSTQQPLGFILARNLLSTMTTPGLLVSAGGRLLFYNDAAGAMLGRSFEDITGFAAAQWTAAFGPLDSSGNVIPYDLIPATLAIRSNHAYHGEFLIRSANGGAQVVSASAFPIEGPDDRTGAMVMFWRIGA